MINKIKELAKIGKTDNEISELLNLSYNKVRHIRRVNRILSGEKHKRIINLEKIKILHDEGKTFSDISKILNIPHSSVAEYAHSLKLKPNWTKRSYFNELDRIKGYMIRNSKHSAKRRNLKFNIEYTDIILPKKCPLLEKPLNYKGNFQDPYYPTLDRIDNTKGYIKGNIMVLSRLANSMKNSACLNELELFSKNIQTIIKLWGARGNITDIFPNIEILDEFSLDS